MIFVDLKNIQGLITKIISGTKQSLEKIFGILPAEKKPFDRQEIRNYIFIRLCNRLLVSHPDLNFMVRVAFCLLKELVMKRLSRSALLIIDVQNYFFDISSPAYIRGSERLISVINELIEKFKTGSREVIFTRQIFPKNRDNPLRRWWRRLPRGEECELYREFRVEKGDKIIDKEQYSAFFKTSLDSYLKRKRIGRLFFCGVMTHLCVETSIREAFMLGYSCYLIEDATMSKNVEYHRASILNLSHGFCRIIRTEDINEYL